MLTRADTSRSLNSEPDQVLAPEDDNFNLKLKWPIAADGSSNYQKLMQRGKGIGFPCLSVKQLDRVWCCSRVNEERVESSRQLAWKDW